MSFKLSDNNFNQRKVVNEPHEFSRTLIGGHSGNEPKIIKKENILKTFRIRKLTPTECFRLQGMEDSDVLRAKEMGVSESALYKIAGNGLTTNCVQFIMEHLFKAKNDHNYHTTDERMAAIYGNL